MTRSLKILMYSIIDYIGLFPPEQLSLDDALNEYTSYGKGDYSWMLGDFVIPAAKLKELIPLQDKLFTRTDTMDFSILGNSGDTNDGFLKGMDQMIKRVDDFHDRQRGGIHTEKAEIMLSKEATTSGDKKAIIEMLDDIAGRMDARKPAPRRIFYEPQLSENWRNEIRIVLQAISEHNEGIKKSDKLHRYRFAGLKFRCGGVEESMFPSLEKLAFTLSQVKEYKVPIKCSAGFNHPVRTFVDSQKIYYHGFFNVLAASLFAIIYDLNDQELIPILNSEDPTAFKFSDEKFMWQDYKISANEMEQLRKTRFISFSNHRLDLPIKGLQQMNLL